MTASPLPGGVALLDQEPVLTLAAGMAPAHPHQGPFAVQFLPVQLEFERALFVGLLGIGIERRPAAAIPDHRGAGAILALGDDSFEAAIFERMVLDMNREPLFSGIGTRPFRH